MARGCASTPPAYNRVRLSPHRGDRKAGFAAFHGALQAFKSTLAASVHATLKEHVFEARARRYGSCLEAALHGNEVDPAVYAMLIREVNAALPLIHRYLRLRARVLRIPDLAYHDLYAPLAPEPAGRYAWDQARELVTSALAPLGPDYVEQLTRALQSRWVDVDPRTGKRSGAFVNDGAYDAHPYMLLNHQDDYHSASTLAHEAGHLMHSTYSQRHQPYPTARYVIFVAEVASTFNEILLHRYLLDRAEDDERRLALLGHYLDNIRGTVFRQTMFAEFELEIHARAERGEALTGEELGAIYFELLQRYHGTADGVLAIDPLYAAEWGFVPHFHYNFYVYQYATSYVAATALARRILSGSTSATIRYLDFLSRGSARPPVELLRDAGVDMTSSEPIQATMTEMSEVMDAMDAILARRG
ncbi:MAG: oligoendopeptidase F family protein [Acidobacteria bacterium]|nr:oligoendopeptidase F family protein [Acidobacteriota bacterium]